MLWLAEHAGELLAKYLVGRDGRTAFERLMGKPSRGDRYEFGERVFYRARPPGMGRSLSPRRESGVWPGQRWGTVARIVAVGPRE
eukprot:10067335-Alexandrium_andersonii.AAC.1